VISVCHGLSFFFFTSKTSKTSKDKEKERERDRKGDVGSVEVTKKGLVKVEIMNYYWCC